MARAPNPNGQFGQEVQVVMVTPELKRGRNKLAATVVLGHVIKHVYNSGFQTIILPEIKIGLGLSATELGWIAASRQATGWFTTMGAGYAADRFANRASLMLGLSLSLMGISYFIAGNAPNFWMMLGAMLLVGIGPSIYHPPAIGALSRRFPDRRGFALSLHGAGGSTGEVLGPLVTAGALAVLVWQDVLRVGLFPALLAALLIWSLMRGVPSAQVTAQSTAEYFSSIMKLLKKGAMLTLVGVTVLRSMGQSSVTIFLPVYLREDLEYSALRVALYLSMAQVVGIGAQPVMGILSDRFGRKAVIVPSMFGMGLLFVALRYADPGPQLILTIIAMGAFLYSLHSLFIASALDVAGGQLHSTVVSMIYGASFLGILAPVLAGLIADRYGTENAFLFAGALVFLSAVIILFLRLPRTATQVAGGHR